MLPFVCLFVFFSFCFVCVLFETGFHYITLLAWNSERSSCLWFLYVEIKGIYLASSQFFMFTLAGFSPRGLCVVSHTHYWHCCIPLSRILPASTPQNYYCKADVRPCCRAFINFILKILILYFLCVCVSAWVYSCEPHAAEAYRSVRFPGYFWALETTPGSSL